MSIGRDNLDPLSSISTQQGNDLRIVFLEQLPPLRIQGFQFFSDNNDPGDQKEAPLLRMFLTQQYDSLYDQARSIWALTGSLQSVDRLVFLKWIDFIVTKTPESLERDLLLEILLPRYVQYHTDSPVAFIDPNLDIAASRGFPHCMTPRAVRDIGHLVASMLSFNPGKPTYHNLMKILLKCDVRKGARRAFHKMVQRVIKKEPSAASFIWSVLLCCIQGNYPHCSATERMPFVQRWHAHMLFGQEPCIGPEPESSALSSDGDHSMGVKVEEKTESTKLSWQEQCLAARTKIRQTLLGNCRYLFEIALREFILWNVDNNQAVADHWRRYIDLNTYRTRVHEAASKVREYFRKNCNNGPNCTLSVGKINTRLDETQYRPYEEELNDLLMKQMEAVVKISVRDIVEAFATRYRQSASKFMPNSEAWRIKYKITDAQCARPVQQSKPVTDKVQDSEKNDDDDELNELNTGMASLAFEQRQTQKDQAADEIARLGDRLLNLDLSASKEDIQFVSKMALDSLERHVADTNSSSLSSSSSNQPPIDTKEEDTPSSPTTQKASDKPIPHCTESTFRVTWAHCAAIQQLTDFMIGRADVDNFIETLVPFLCPHFGATPESVEAMLKVIHVARTRQQTVTKDSWNRLLKRYALRWPYTACLVYCICKVLERYRTLRQTNLTLEQTKYQYEALAARCPLYTDDSKQELLISDCAGKLFFCRVCFEIYSIVITTRTTDKMADGYGLRDAKTLIIDPDDPESFQCKLYCQHQNRFGTWNCQDFELVSILALGVNNSIRNMSLQLCPQRACGRHWLVQSQYTVYNERGAACWHCTRHIILERTMEFVRTAANLGDAWNKPHCCICWKESGTPVLKADNAYMYGGQAVCGKHHSEAMRQRMLQLLPDEMLENIMAPEHQDLIKAKLLVCLQERKNATKKTTTKRARTGQSATAAMRDHFG